MRSPTIDFMPLQYSTSDLPDRDRLPYWREFFSRKLGLCEIEAQSDLPFDAKATLVEWPGLRVVWADIPTPQRLQRTLKMAADGDGSIAVFLKVSGLLAVSQLGRELSLGTGDAVGLLLAEPISMTTSNVCYVALIVPRGALVSLLGDVESTVMRLIGQDNEALRLLTKYLGTLQEDPAFTMPELRHLAVTHIQDLIAMALGATGDGGMIVEARGVRAARLRAIKADILQNLSSRGTTVTAVALRQNISPRYIHNLFETEGITFSEFLLGRRLILAYRMLCDPRCARLTISAIAFEVGFGDLSYFNRTFRRRFGVSPSELRHSIPEALVSSDHEGNFGQRESAHNTHAVTAMTLR